MGWKNWGYTKRGFIIGLLIAFAILFYVFIIKGYIDCKNPDETLQMLQKFSGFQSEPEPLLECMLSSIGMIFSFGLMFYSKQLLLSFVLWIVLPIVLCTGIGWIIGKIKSKKESVPLS
jgi:hypothetical protein